MLIIVVLVFVGVFLVVALLLAAGDSGASQQTKQTIANLQSGVERREAPPKVRFAVPIVETAPMTTGLDRIDGPLRQQTEALQRSRTDLNQLAAIIASAVTSQQQHQ